MDKIAERIDVNKIDDGLIECGKIGSILQTITSIILIMCCCSSGVFAIMQKDYEMETEATITEKPECSYNTITDDKGNVRREINCNIKIKYNVNNTDYNTVINIQEDIYKQNDKIKIKYDKNDPRMVAYKPLNNNFIGGIIFCIAFIGILSLILHLYLSVKSDWYKRYQCINMVGNAI
jgi:hypothetical protein